MKNEQRLKGYTKFLDYLLEKDDVFIVSVQEVIEFLKHPVKSEKYQPRSCVKNPPSTECMSRKGYVGQNCVYDNLPQFWNSTRYLTTCEKKCPTNYPWLGNPLGE